MNDGKQGFCGNKMEWERTDRQFKHSFYGNVGGEVPLCLMKFFVRQDLFKSVNEYGHGLCLPAHSNCKKWK